MTCSEFQARPFGPPSTFLALSKVEIPLELYANVFRSSLGARLYFVFDAQDVTRPPFRFSTTLHSPVWILFAALLFVTHFPSCKPS